MSTHRLVRHVRGLEEVENAAHVPLAQVHHRLHPVRSDRNPRGQRDWDQHKAGRVASEASSGWSQ